MSDFKSHMTRVSKILFASTGDTTGDNDGEKEKSYSCGFDSTVRFWDTEYGVYEHTIVCLLYFIFDLRALLIKPRLKTIFRSHHNLKGHSGLVTSQTEPCMISKHIPSRLFPTSINSFMCDRQHHQFLSRLQVVVIVWSVYWIWEAWKLQWRHSRHEMGGRMCWALIGRMDWLGGLEVWKVGKEMAWSPLGAIRFLLHVDSFAKNIA